jgi:hypothetical protein
MIQMMLGQGMLYRLHHERQQMLNEMERKRARLVCSVITVIAIGALLWLRH